MKPKPSLISSIALAVMLSAMLACSPAPQDGDGKQTPEAAGTPVFKEVSDTLAKNAPYAISLGFAGDICLADNYVPMQHLAAMGTDALEAGIDRRFLEIMNGETLLWVNNEFVLSDRGEPLEGKAWTFKGKTSNVRYLREMGADVVGLANNHVFDYGEAAFLDTLSALESESIPYVGAGRDYAQASSPVYLEADGITVAYVAASCAEYTVYTPEAADGSPGIMWCYDDARFLDEIRRARAGADYVVALPHWGTEHSTELTGKQVESAHAYIDAGADAVIGCHAHNLQGIEFHDGKPICYNLGNFWFDEYDEDTVLAEIRIRGEKPENAPVDISESDIELVLHPGRQKDVFTSYAGDDPGEKRRIFSHIEEISDGKVSVGDDGTVSAR